MSVTCIILKYASHWKLIILELTFAKQNLSLLHLCLTKWVNCPLHFPVYHGTYVRHIWWTDFPAVDFVKKIPWCLHSWSSNFGKKILDKMDTGATLHYKLCINTFGIVMWLKWSFQISKNWDWLMTINSLAFTTVIHHIIVDGHYWPKFEQLTHRLTNYLAPLAHADTG